MLSASVSFTVGLERVTLSLEGGVLVKILQLYWLCNHLWEKPWPSLSCCYIHFFLSSVGSHCRPCCPGVRDLCQLSSSSFFTACEELGTTWVAAETDTSSSSWMVRFQGQSKQQPGHSWGRLTGSVLSPRLPGLVCEQHHCWLRALARLGSPVFPSLLWYPHGLVPQEHF